jgi:hypothetical protein
MADVLLVPTFPSAKPHMKMFRKSLLTLGLLILYSGLTIACDPVWVRATSGEIRIFGKWREFEANAVTVQCGTAAGLPLYARAGTLFRVGSELILAYDGVRLRINALAVNVDLVPNPSAQETYMLNDGIAFRNVRIDVGHQR